MLWLCYNPCIFFRHFSKKIEELLKYDNIFILFHNFFLIVSHLSLWNLKLLLRCVFLINDCWRNKIVYKSTIYLFKKMENGINNDDMIPSHFMRKCINFNATVYCIVILDWIPWIIYLNFMYNFILGYLFCSIIKYNLRTHTTSKITTSTIKVLLILLGYFASVFFMDILHFHYDVPNLNNSIFDNLSNLLENVQFPFDQKRKIAQRAAQNFAFYYSCTRFIYKFIILFSTLYVNIYNFWYSLANNSKISKYVSITLILCDTHHTIYQSYTVNTICCIEANWRREIDKFNDENKIIPIIFISPHTPRDNRNEENIWLKAQNEI